MGLFLLTAFPPSNDSHFYAFEVSGIFRLNYRHNRCDIVECWTVVYLFKALDFNDRSSVAANPHDPSTGCELASLEPIQSPRVSQAGLRLRCTPAEGRKCSSLSSLIW